MLEILLIFCGYIFVFVGCAGLIGSGRKLVVSSGLLFFSRTQFLAVFFVIDLDIELFYYCTD